ncbi:selenocysteine lyase [Salpingoeca rosetta]|uniref:Selenocysteine lyase n=1 Tax=Salpingoeca rosetta (strain ATCC 50818 / BSB-021) TaxID=946362 RepID=F2U0U7_SALR5|nr:selenocysteine lyase [Salpingoeca rosetta]EGD80521.1 selenocysteine lyase [Salpingoeca rosetta]|eukprot:XP_004997082.1 selenocysteine lyase [Salpingoeca rosetta]
MEGAVYLDSNATTPLAAEVKAAVVEAMDVAWGNPSSTYAAGLAAKQMISESRKHTADMIGADASEIVFMSGGTEINNHVIHTALEAFHRSGRSGLPHIITSNIEHDSVEKVLAALEHGNKAAVTRVKADSTTYAVPVDAVLAALTDNTCLVTIMLANNETGVIQPVSDIFQHIRQDPKHSHILLHTDAAQAIGKIPVHVDALRADCVTLVGHKFYAPRIGAVYVRQLGKEGGVPFHAMLYGGGQERNYRPGTENTPMIAGFGAACQLVCDHLPEYLDHMQSMRDHLHAQLKAAFGTDAVRINGPADSLHTAVLPNTLNFSIMSSDLSGRAILKQLPSICASVGSACHSDCGDRPSQILMALGIDHEQARRAMRWSVGRDTTEEQIDAAVANLARVLKQ